MPKSEDKRITEFKAGLFIIISISLLIFSILWLRYFAVRPVMTVIAEFRNPGPITSGMQAYYQGVNIGKAAKVDFSKDFRNTLIYINIYKKVRLPDNVIAKITSQGITGQKYLEIVYPDSPSSNILANNNVIKGVKTFDLSDLSEIIEKQVKTGRLQRILRNMDESLLLQKQLSVQMQSTFTNMNDILMANKGGINSLIANGSRAAMDLSRILGNINDIVGNPNTKRDVQSLVKEASGTVKGVNLLINDGKFAGNLGGALSGIGKISDVISQAQGALSGLNFGEGSNFANILKDTDILIRNLNYYSSDIYKDIKQTGLIENASITLNKTGLAVDKLTTDASTGQTKNLIVETLQSANQATKRMDCTYLGISKMLSKRFIILRLLFGRPGNSLDNCTGPDCYENKTCPVKPEKSP